MHRFVALLLALAMSACVAFAQSPSRGLEVQIAGMALLDEWREEASDAHDYLAVYATLTNWHNETIQLESSLRAELRYAQDYVFEAALDFPMPIMEQLVQMDGALVFRIPNMLAERAPEGLALTIFVEGSAVPQEIALDARPRAQYGQLECAGFESPEDAVMAYIEAMRELDVQGMLSSFAIERFVEHSNPQLFLERIRAFTMSAEGALPVSEAYPRAIAVAQRYGNLADRLYRQYLYYTWPEEYGEFDGSTLIFKEDGEIQAFVSQMESPAFISDLASAEWVEFIEPSSLSEIYLRKTNLEQIAKQARSYGCDELRDVVARLNIGGREALLCMQCARYGERWYNFSFGGNIGNILGLEAYCAGLICPRAEQ